MALTYYPSKHLEMPAAIALGSLLVSYLACSVALVFETPLVSRGFPRRGIWIVSLALSILLTAAIAYNLMVAPERSASLLQYAMPITSRPVGRFIQEAWLATCLINFFLPAWQWYELRNLHRSWNRTEIEGKNVYVSSDFGPASVGLLKPCIVIPQWLLTSPASVRKVALAHEREHIESKDALCYLSGFLMQAVMPWNPALSLQLRHLRLAIEIDCDARVLLKDPSLETAIYADAILQLWRGGRSIGGVSARPGPDSDVHKRLVILSVSEE